MAGTLVFCLLKVGNVSGPGARSGLLSTEFQSKKQQQKEMY
jgi:hypothetical protein